MAVADVFAALREDRPYRPNMEKSRVAQVMRGMVKDSALDGAIVDLLFDQYGAAEEAVTAACSKWRPRGKNARSEGPAESAGYTR